MITNNYEKKYEYLIIKNALGIYLNTFSVIINHDFQEYI